MEEARIQRETYGKVLYTTVGKKCYKITSQGCEEVQALQCQQKEADRRLLFHAAREGYQSILISAEDTDVFIMYLAFHDKI